MKGSDHVGSQSRKGTRERLGDTVNAVSVTVSKSHSEPKRTCQCMVVQTVDIDVLDPVGQSLSDQDGRARKPKFTCKPGWQ